MVLSSRKVWVSGIALSGVLLLSSMAGVHTPAQAAEPTQGLPAARLAANKPMSGYSAQAVRKKIVVAAQPAFANVVKPVQTVQIANAQDSAANDSAKNEAAQVQAVKKPVKVASATSASRPPVHVSRSSADSSLLIRNAMSLQGTPYVFGGTSRNGFDCSGFTQYVFKGSGISLPRTSYEQYNVGTSVSRSELQPGDLVFFSTYAKGASHVGIYVGGGQFIHASDSGVRTTSLSDSYYAKRYLGARRVK